MMPGMGGPWGGMYGGMGPWAGRGMMGPWGGQFGGRGFAGPGVQARDA